MTELNQHNFSESVASGLHLVDFSTPACGPCIKMEPILEQLSGQGVSIFKIDASAETELAARFSVRNVPTFLVIKDGELKQRIVGYTPGQKLLDALHANSAG